MCPRCLLTEPRIRRGERFQDQLDADRAASAWLTQIAEAAGGPHRHIESKRLAQSEGGRVTTFWHNERLAAATVVVRDSRNFSVLFRWLSPATLPGAKAGEWDAAEPDLPSILAAVVCQHKLISRNLSEADLCDFHGDLQELFATHLPPPPATVPDPAPGDAGEVVLLDESPRDDGPGERKE